MGLTDPLAGAIRGRRRETRRGRRALAAQSGPSAAGAVCERSEEGSTWPPRRGRRGGAGLCRGPDASSRPSARSSAFGARAGPGGSAPPTAAARGAGGGRAGGGLLRGGWPSARWRRWRRRRPEPGRSGERGRGAEGRGRRGERAAFPIPNYEPRVCRWGCSAAPAAEREQQRRAQGSGGGAEAAEVRAGELLGPPRCSGNGLAARRGGRRAPCCSSPCATRGPRPAPPPQHLGSVSRGPGRRRRRGSGGLLACLARPGRRRWGALCRAPGHGAAGGPERGNVSGSCCRPPRGGRLSTRSPARPRLEQGWGWGRAGPPPGAWSRARAPTPSAAGVAFKA